MSNEPMPIQWELNGDKECGYTNWVGITPFGRILITWKSWKDFPEASVDEFPGGFESYGSPDAVKAACDLEFAKRFRIAAPDDTALLRQCLDALEHNGLLKRKQCITALRTALAESPDSTKPVAEPVQEPLTDEEVLAILGDLDPDAKRLPPGLKAFTRAIERAHGIGGEA